MLSYPITGKVVTAHAHLTPRTLDLGTACVGTPIVGNVTMVNDGTATLRPGTHGEPGVHRVPDHPAELPAPRARCWPRARARWRA